MYLEHYGFQHKPFSMAHHASIYYSVPHQEATNELCYSLEERQGLAILLGEPGTGKTTLLRNLVRSFSSDWHPALVSDVSIIDSSLLSYLVRELGLPEPDGRAPEVIRGYFHESARLGRQPVVLVDEAQSLTDRQFEELRYLTNLEFQNHKLVQLVLAGQPSLEDRLLETSAEALGQRVAVRTYLKPLSPAHTRGYIRLRLRVAGAKSLDLFTPAALEEIHEHSRGVPRLINLICDRALVLGYAENMDALDASVIREVWGELKSQAVSQRPRPSASTSPSVSARLTSIEAKLDLLISAMEQRGLPLSGESSSSLTDAPKLSDGAPTEPAESASDESRAQHRGRVADFSPRPKERAAKNE